MQNRFKAVGVPERAQQRLTLGGQCLGTCQVALVADGIGQEG